MRPIKFKKSIHRLRRVKSLLYSNKAHQIVAVAGSLDPSLASEASNRQVSEGAEVRLAPGYVDGTRLDLALIRLKRPFEWRTEFVQPICLPDLQSSTARLHPRRVNKTLDSTKTGMQHF